MAKKQKVLLAERVIAPRAYGLKNGNLLIESELLDSVHLISLKLEVEPGQRKVIKASAQMRSVPFIHVCPRVLVKVKKLKGLIIQKGVLREVAELLGGEAGCVHLRNLATIAIDFFSGIVGGYEKGMDHFAPQFERQPEGIRYEAARSYLRGTCLAFPKDPPSREATEGKGVKK